VHVASYYLQRALQPGVADLLRQARAGGATTSLDPGWDPADRWDGGLAAALRETDVQLVNEAEAARIADHGVATCAVKLGAAGALLRRGGEEVRVDAPAAEVVDTIGAGDSFGAGLLCGLLGGASTEEALRLAVACGSLSVRAAGGTDGQATLAEALALAATLSGRPAARRAG
jgi:sugar/nucleoside kinase (ribokinase family)